VLFGELMSGRAVYDRASLRPLRNDDTAGPEIDDEVAGSPEPLLVDTPVDDDPEEIAARVAGDGPALDMSAVASDLTIGRVRIVLLAAMSEARDAAIGADTLAADALRHGLSVCRVDAGSGRVSTVPGLTDLSAGRATFGDVVHKLRGGLAEVPWGQMPVLDRRSDRPLTLVEALADVYEVVIVSTGRISVNSSLPMFAGLASRLVIVFREETPAAYVEAVADDARSLGFPEVENVILAEPQSAVA
jgi:succinoglycan biosynthesis transport protein ExoP